ncbi:MAG TPA: IclR family transcriptional regulator [Solirubrobacteraceae bacterium]|nr:IclR family transcriptional regulator [Solirubrobacteraceae bacterium]
MPAAIGGRLCYPAHSQSLERGLGILACFAPESWVLGVAEIAERLGMARSTTHRYVTTLVALGYLERDDRRKYRLALRVTELGMSAASATTLREHAGDDLQELCRRTGFAVGLGVLDGSDVVVVEWLRGTRGAHEALSKLNSGTRLPANCTALGKMLLAEIPPSNRCSLTDELVFERRGPGTLRSKAALHRELLQIGEAGLAVADEEFAEGLYAIAAPVRAHSRETVAAVGMAARASAISLEDLVDALGPHLISTADRISARLGHRRDDELPGQA